MRPFIVFFICILATAYLAGCHSAKDGTSPNENPSEWSYSSVNDAVNGTTSSAKKRYITGDDGNSVTMITFTCYKTLAPRTLTITIGSYYDDSTMSNHMMGGDQFIEKNIAFNLDSGGKSNFQDTDNEVPHTGNLSNEINKQFLTVLSDSINKRGIMNKIMQTAAIAQMQRSSLGDDPTKTNQEKELENSDAILSDNFNFNYKTLAFNYKNTHGDHTISINLEEPAITKVANNCGWSKHPLQQTAQPSQEAAASSNVASSPAETQAVTAQDQTNPQEGAAVPALTNENQDVRPSFECRGSLSSVEKIICSDDRLAQKDFDLNQAYKTLRITKNGSQRIDLINEQRRWMIQRTQCNNAPCLKNMYDSRIAILRNY